MNALLQFHRTFIGSSKYFVKLHPHKLLRCVNNFDDISHTKKATNELLSKDYFPVYSLSYIYAGIICKKKINCLRVSFRIQ